LPNWIGSCYLNTQDDERDLLRALAGTLGRPDVVGVEGTPGIVDVEREESKPLSSLLS
jgi:hypothetical protein